MKKLIALYLFLSLLLCGCYVNSENVLFQQSPEKIISVEFVDNENDVVLYSITDESALHAFINDLSSIPCKRHFNDPPAEYGDHLIRLYYIDGSIEIVSSSACGYINAENEENMNMWYYLEFDSFQSLFAKYTNDV